LAGRWNHTKEVSIPGARKHPDDRLILDDIGDRWRGALIAGVFDPLKIESNG